MIAFVISLYTEVSLLDQILYFVSLASFGFLAHLHKQRRCEETRTGRKGLVELDSSSLHSISYGDPKVSRQFQFVHGNFNFTQGNFNLFTAISIYSRQFQFVQGNFIFTHGNFNFTHGNFNFTHGNFNLFSAISIYGNFNFSSNKPQVHCTLFQEPITRSEQLPCVVVTHFPSVSIAFFSLSVENRFLLFELSFPFPLIS